MPRWGLAALLALGLCAGEETARAGELELGVGVDFLPVGGLSLFSDTFRAESSTAPAFAIAPRIQYYFVKYLAVGLQPVATVGVKSSGDFKSSTQLDLLGRITGNLPVTDKLSIYAYAAPGYSFMFVPRTPSEYNPRGFILNFAGGVSYNLFSAFWLSAEVGGSAGFQKIFSGPSAMSYRDWFLHIGLGLGVRL
jgi:hypothetical protein